MNRRILLAPAAVAGVVLLAAVAPSLRAQMTTGPATPKTFGLGLPRDRDKLVLPDSAYPRFPLLPGQEAYKDVDGPKSRR